MFPRKMFWRLKEQAKNKKISLLLGARQVGKTTLLKELYAELSKTNKCLFLDLDIISNYEKASTYEGILNTLKLNGYEESQKDFFYMLLDEFQRYPAVTMVMKNIYDNHDNIKIYASGSSSMAIKDRVQESLAGRKKINELFPLDFEEFLWFKQDKNAIRLFPNLRKLRGENLQPALREFSKLLEEYLIFGGYPEVVLNETIDGKVGVLSSIFDTYVKKDLVDYLNIDKILGMKKLIEFLAVNNGQKIRYEEVTKLTSLRFNEAKKYIELLKETYLIEVLRPFYTNKNKELVKIPKVYFVDNGVRNFFVNNFNEMRIRGDAGFLFEGFVVAELLKAGAKNLRFWQDKNGNEVDVITEKNSSIAPVEAKFKQKLKADDFRGVSTFLKEYPKTRDSYIVSTGSQKTAKNIHQILPYCIRQIV